MPPAAPLCPYALLVTGPLAEDARVAACSIPGVKFHRGKLIVPWHALKIVDALGLTYKAVHWAVPPQKALTWEEIEERLRAGGEVRPEVFEPGFLLDHQHNALLRGAHQTGFHIHHATGAGKTLSAYLLALLTAGTVVFVTKSSARTQMARELTRFTYVQPYVLRSTSAESPETIDARVAELRKLLRQSPDPEAFAGLEGATKADEKRLRKAEREARQTQEKLTKQLARALDRQERVHAAHENTYERYLQKREAAGERAFLIVGWDTLVSYMPLIRQIGPTVVVFDESHRGKSSKRWDRIPLGSMPDLDDQPGEYQSILEAQSAEAKARGGFVAEDDGARTMIVPKNNMSVAGGELARLSSVLRRICTTATPVKNLLQDFWSQLDFAEPNAWGNADSFERRYCLSPETLVLRPDGTYSPIVQVQVGDQLVGWGGESYRLFKPATVIWKGLRIADRVRVTLSDGTVVVCTPDHNWLYNASAQAVTPYKALYGEFHHGRWRRPRKHLVRVWAAPAQHEATVPYMEGYVRGLIDGDGYISAQKKYPRAAAAGVDLEHLTQAHQFAVTLGYAPTPLKKRSDGLYQFHLTTRTGFEKFYVPWKKGDPDYLRGWLAGMHDAEGTDTLFAQSPTANPDKYAFLQEALAALGYASSAGAEGIRLLGGRTVYLNFRDRCRPVLVRKGLHAWQGHGVRFSGEKVEIISIEALPPGPVISIQTTTGNYVAEGLGSKNCNKHRDNNGFMDSKGISNPEELVERLRFVVHRVEYAETHRTLPPKRRQSLYVAPEDQCAPTGDFVREVREAKARGSTAVIEVKLAEAASKKRKVVCSYVEDHVRSGHKVVLFTARRRDCEELGKELRRVLGKDMQIWALHGGQSEGLRQQAIDDYMAHPGPCVFVGTGDAFGESLNIQRTDAAFFVMLPYTPGQLRQWEGRFARHGQDRPVIIYYVIAERTIDEHIAGILIDKLPAIEKVALDAELAAAGAVLGGIEDGDAIVESIVGKLTFYEDDEE